MKLLGITDLVDRWNYTRQGIHQKMKQDDTFLKAIAVVNKKTLVFNEDNIVNYQNNRKELTDSKYKEWHTTRKWLYKEKMSE